MARIKIPNNDIKRHKKIFSDVNLCQIMSKIGGGSLIWLLSGCLSFSEVKSLDIFWVSFYGFFTFVY